jgi:DNA-binding NtrC family response regulator
MAIRVLLIDDEVAFAETMTKRLTKRNLSVVSASSGTRGIDLLRQADGADVVVLDVKMPDMDGVETLREIKREFPLVEVIMLTGHATVESAIEGMRLGAFDYLMKPCDVDLLISRIHAAKAKKSNREQKINRSRPVDSALRG